MNLTNIPNLRAEDFSADDKDLVTKLFVQLNPFISSLSQILNQNIDYASNIKSVTQSFNVKDIAPFSIAWNYINSPPQDVRIINAYKGAALTPSILLCSWSFDATQKSITISNIYEVTSTGIAVAAGIYQYVVRATI